MARQESGEGEGNKEAQSRRWNRRRKSRRRRQEETWTEADLGLLRLMFYSLSTLCFREVRHKSNSTTQYRRQHGGTLVSSSCHLHQASILPCKFMWVLIAAVGCLRHKRETPSGFKATPPPLCSSLYSSFHTVSMSRINFISAATIRHNLLAPVCHPF